MLLSGGSLLAQRLHVWDFKDPAGTALAAAANSGTVGGLAFAGGDMTWAADGSGSLLIKSTTGDALIQSNANMGELNGKFTIQYDLGWDFATAAASNHRELFLISRTSAGADPAGNQFRFNISVNSGTSALYIATSTAGVAGGGNYNSPVTIADLSTQSSGMVSLAVTYTWNEDNTQLNSIEAHYSTDGGRTWTAMDLGGTFTPYAITNLGDLRIHGKGLYSDTDYYRVERVMVNRGGIEDLGKTFNLAPNGDFEDRDDSLTWDDASGGVGVFTYPDTEGNGGGHATIQASGTWAVLVSATTGGAQGGGVPVEALGIEGGTTVTFRYDTINFDGAGPVGGMKVEAWANNSPIANTGDIRPAPIGDGSTWETYRLSWAVPAGTEKIIFVPLWESGGAKVGFDNIGVMGNPISSPIAPNGDFEDADASLTWDTADGGGAIFDFPATGGNPGGFASIQASGTWAVLVSATTGGAQGGGIPIESFGIEGGDSVTFRYDSINLGGAGKVGGMKVEAWANNSPLGNTGDIRPATIGDGSTWETYAFRWKLPAGTEKLIFVPLWEADGSPVGFDNIGIMPPTPLTGTHLWTFDGPAGETIDMVPNEGTKGGVSFAGGSPDWTTDGQGRLLIQSDSGENLIQSNANLGNITGTYSIQYDLSWNFATAVSGGNREVFLISRTSSGENPAGNQFRFSLTVYSGTSLISLATQTAGIAGGDNYNNPTPIADLTTTPTGTVSVKVAYAWNEDNTLLNSIACEYSLDGGDTWTAYDHDLGDAFVPYAISDLGDLRIHTKGAYSATDYWSVDAVIVSGGTYPAASSWAGFPLTEGFAFTDFLGWIYPADDSVYILTLNAWAYLPESYVYSYGAWMYRGGR